MDGQKDRILNCRLNISSKKGRVKTVQNLGGKHHLVINCQASKTKNLSKPRWTAPAKTDRDGDHDGKKVTMFATVVQVGSFLAVQNSSIGDLVPWSVPCSDSTNNQTFHNTTE